VLLAASLLLGGCVSLTPQQRTKVDEIQSFADRTTRIYDLPGVRISIQPATNLNIGAMYRQGNIFVNVRMLDSPSLTKVIAHELGHYVLGHEPAASVSSQTAWLRAQQQRELDANAKAVEILVRANGMSRREAVQMVSEALQRAQDAVDRGAPLTPGHLTPAEELRDLKARFPEARETWR
jgi:Zn-dependent peptidase ImmA (M78 family)